MTPTHMLRSRMLAALALAGVTPAGGCAAGNSAAGSGPSTTSTQSSTQQSSSSTQPVNMAVASSVTVVPLGSSAAPDAGNGYRFTCPSGNEAMVSCFTREELIQRIMHPPQGGKPGDRPQVESKLDRAEVEKTLDANGCAPRTNVENGCCNRATNGPAFDGGKCCYGFCSGSCCGRPFISQGIARVASCEKRTDWLGADHTAELDLLNDVDRGALRDAWLADALAEHASIASFARFTLDLLSVGAPAHLVTASQTASLDEVDHARRCFSIASRFAGSPLGPGTLSMQGALRENTLVDVVISAIREGCVGETLAATIALTQLERARDPQVRETLAVIARDEAVHAEVAWRFVAWAVRLGDDHVKRAVQRTFDEVLAAVPTPPARVPEGVTLSAWQSHGRLSSRDWTVAARSTLSEVVVPCMQVVLGSQGTPTLARGIEVPV